MKNFRKPYLSMIMATIFLFVSCNQYDTIETENNNKFDYSAFKKVKNSNLYEAIINQINKKGSKEKLKSTFDKNKSILNIVNMSVGSSLVLPDLVLTLGDNNSEEIYKIALNNKWLSEKDISMTKSLMSDIKTKGFENAISNYEKTVLSLSLSPEEFSKKNIFVNTIKSLNYVQPNLFKTSLFSKSSIVEEGPWWRCALAIVALTSTTAGLTSCVTIAACGLAITLHIAATLAVRDNCKDID